MKEPRIEPVLTQVQVPPGMLGPDAVSFEVRCFVVADASGIVLVDTGTPGSADAVGMALGRVGASWADVSDIVLAMIAFAVTLVVSFVVLFRLFFEPAGRDEE